MNIQKRNYDEELTVLLRVAMENSSLISSSFTYLDIVQDRSPVLNWIESQTRGKEVEDANT